MTKVLIVDDQPDSLRLLETTLTKHGFSVVSARNGMEALAQARIGMPDLVVSDLLMPVMDGYTLLKHWKSDVVCAHVPFVIYTATFTDVDDMQFGENLGADAFILKPARMADLIGELRRVLAKNAVRIPAAAATALPVDADDVTLKYYSERLIRKLEEKTVQLERANQALQREISEHQQANEQIQFNHAILKTQQEASLDGILVVSTDGRVLSYNRRFLELWGIGPELMEECRTTPLAQSTQVIAEIGRRLADPAAYLAKVRHLHAHRDETSFAEVRTVHGTTLDVYSAPAVGAEGRHYGRIWYYRDVTEYRLLLDSIHEKAVQLSNAQRIGRMGSWSSDARSGRVTWADSTCELFGIRHDEFHGTFEHFRSFIVPEDRAAFDAAYANVSAENPMMEMEYRIRRPDGEVRWIYARGNVEFGADGAPLSRAGMVMDITEQRLVHEQLARNDTLLRMAGRLSRMGGWSIDTHAGSVFWSEETCRLHEVPVGHTPSVDELLEFYPPESRETFMHAYTHCRDGGYPFDLELQLITARGNTLWVRVTGEAWDNEANHTRLVQGAIQDISAQKAAEEEIHGLGNRLVETFESITGGFYTLDTDWNFTYVNRRAEGLLRRDRAGLLGRNIWAEFPALDASIEPNYRRVAAERQSLTFEEYYAPLKTWFEINVYPSHTGLAVYFHDITHRKETEAQLAYLHRVRAVLSGINALIVRVNDRAELFSEACRIAYESGEFNMAMLCVVDPRTGTIEPVASEGKDETLMGLVRATLASPATAATTMISRAIATARPVVSNDVAADDSPLHGERYLERGVRSIAVLPLNVRDKAIGVLVLYAKELGFFQDDEMSLLTEMADDVAFAADHIEKKERLDYLANFDTLTGLANRALFLERLREHMKLASQNDTRLCIALVDLARFKNINDTLGRGSGDELLRLVAEWMIRNTGSPDQVARIGADQFIVLFVI
ncbi:MAG TPA: PAS domain S-box protein, partial [Pseudomonadales bacterium]